MYDKVCCDGIRASSSASSSSVVGLGVEIYGGWLVCLFCFVCGDGCVGFNEG